MDIRISSLLAAIGLLAAGLACGQEPETPAPAVKETAARIGSSAFCLYELPAEDGGKRRWLNLGIVQYLEFSQNELRIYYGGGNLGSGHEARLPIATPAQLDETLAKILRTAASCR